MFRVPAAPSHTALPVWCESALRQIEHAASLALAPHTLMMRAGSAVAALARARYPHARCALVLCGPGNNGGDGLTAASILADKGLEVGVLLIGCGDPSQWTPDQRPTDWCWALGKARSASLHPKSWTAADASTALEKAELVIDAILGIGLRRPPNGEVADAIAALHHAHVPILSVDIPSGIFSDTGIAPGPCVHAQATVTMLGLKPGLLTGPGASTCGELWLDTLDIDPDVLSPRPAPAARLLDAARAMGALPNLDAAAHKGQRGDVRVFGGERGMTGAILLCARAALAMGAGRVFAALFDPTAPAVDLGSPELMLRSPAALLHQAREASGATQTCNVFGPGAGTSAEALNALSSLLECESALVIDADGLNLLAMQPRDGTLWKALHNRRAPTWLTPHPREAARLLQREASDIQADRLRAARELAAQTQAHCVLKGAGTVIATPTGELWINPTGNGLLATAGTGDILAGAIAASIAQKRLPDSSVAAACAAVWLHGAGADLARREQAGLRAGTLPDWMSRAWPHCEP